MELTTVITGYNQSPVTVHLMRRRLFEKEALESAPEGEADEADDADTTADGIPLTEEEKEKKKRQAERAAQILGGLGSGGSNGVPGSFLARALTKESLVKTGRLPKVCLRFWTPRAPFFRPSIRRSRPCL